MSEEESKELRAKQDAEKIEQSRKEVEREEQAQHLANEFGVEWPKPSRAGKHRKSKKELNDDKIYDKIFMIINGKVLSCSLHWIHVVLCMLLLKFHFFLGFKRSG